MTHPPKIAERTAASTGPTPGMKPIGRIPAPKRKAGSMVRTPLPSVRPSSAQNPRSGGVGGGPCIRSTSSRMRS